MLEVFADWIVGVLECYDVDSIGRKVFGDLDALLGKLKVEVLDALDGFLIQLNGLGEDVPAKAIG
jgi:hypothetical protein